MPRKAKEDRPVWAKTISEARTCKHITQARLGQLISHSASIIKKYEAGYTVPSLTTLINIADILSLNIHTLAKQAGYSEKDLAKEAKMYWVSWITVPPHNKPCRLSTQNGYCSYEKAKEALQWYIDNDEYLIAAWIDEYKNNQKNKTLDLTILIDALGNKRYLKNKPDNIRRKEKTL